MINGSTQSECAERLKVLADPTRLAVVRQLMGGPKHVSGINAELRLDQSLLSHHLKILRDHRIVEARRQGRVVLYRLAPDVDTGRDGVHLGCCSLSFS